MDPVIPMTEAVSDRIQEISLDTEPVAEPFLLTEEEPSSTQTAKKRDFSELILDACQQTDGSVRENKRVLLLVESLNLSPVPVKDNHGDNCSLLGHDDILVKLAAGSPVTITIDPTLLRTVPKNCQCDRCLRPPIPGLEALFEKSPYVSILRNIEFVELSKDICDILNDDWVRCPQLKYACARMLAGCILYNTVKGQAVIINCNEVYGRKKQVDVHREPFRLNKGHVPQTSIPPFAETRYDDVWPMTMSSKDGDRL
ncbi:hypothetical protein BGZ79_004759, partial [Entomortierella chlamydospora]